MTGATSFARPSPRPRRAQQLAGLLGSRSVGIGLFLIVSCIGFSIVAPNFGQVENARNIALNSSILIVIACAEAVVVITRNYDLSVGSIATLAAYVGFDIVRHSPDIGPALVIVPVVVGTACGIVNGALVAYLRVPSIVATLGSMFVFRGMAFVYSAAHGANIQIKDLPAWVQAISQGQILGVPYMVVISGAVVACGAFLLHSFRFGRQIYAIGSNPAAAEFYGLRANAVIFRAYVLCGAVTGFAAVLLASRASWIVPYLGQGVELTALASVVVGGVSVLGGVGTVVGAALGAVTLTTFDNGLVLLGSSEFARHLVHGVAIIAAVVFDAVSRRRVQASLSAARHRRFDR